MGSPEGHLSRGFVIIGIKYTVRLHQVKQGGEVHPLPSFLRCLKKSGLIRVKGVLCCRVCFRHFQKSKIFLTKKELVLEFLIFLKTVFEF